MPTIKGSVTAATEDALATENLRKLSRPHLVTLAACGQTVTDRMKLKIGQQELTNNLQPNLRADADVGPLVSDDVLVDQEIVPAGELSLVINPVGAQVQYVIYLKPI